MLPPKPLPSAQQRLLKLFRQLPESGQQSLLSYAEFLVERGAAALPLHPAAPARPADIPRPESESVIGAIRRLSQTFHMLDKDDLLHETSALMTAHVMQGRPAAEVIDELEVVFHRHYERVKSASDEGLEKP